VGARLTLPCSNRLLAKYAQTVGCCRSPGLTAMGASARIGSRRTLLWSAWWSTTTDLASSSRSQVHRSPRWAKFVAGLLRLSIDVRGSSHKNSAVVTQLVTRQVG
jgi:hypothetical protein